MCTYACVCVLLSDGDAAAPAKIVNMNEVTGEEKKKRWKSWSVRVFWSWVMVIGCNLVVFTLRQPACMAIVFVCQALMYREVSIYRH